MTAASKSKKTLTELAVKRMRPPDEGRVEVWDAVVPGFGLRVNQSGTKSWVLMTRTHGKQMRITLGRYPALSVVEAREKAREALNISGRGDDPRKRNYFKPSAKGNTLAEHIEHFIQSYAATHHARTLGETQRIFNTYVLAELGHYPVHAITRHDVMELVQGIARRNGPIMANRVLGKLRVLFKWLLSWEAIRDNPAEGVEAPGKERDRDRILEDIEITRIWEAAQREGYPYGHMIRFLLLTGQRRGEVSQMRWSEVDPDQCMWNLPKERTKSERAHSVPLSLQAMAVLSEVPHTGEFIFTTTGTGPFYGFSKCKRRLDSDAEVSGWTLHDLRRTCASGLARLGVEVHVMAKILNHSMGKIQGITGVYNRYQYEDEKRQALAQWGAYVERLVG